jgi:hypothetical protein
MKHVRVRFKEDGDVRGDLIVDLPLDDQNVIAHDIPFAGWWGIPKGNNWIRPVVFKPNGEVEFGGDPEDPEEERISDMRIHGVPLKIGLQIVMIDREEGALTTFILTTMHNLDDLGAIS